jgi:RING finger protein 122
MFLFSLSIQSCVICFEDFYQDEEIAVCPCEHAFHKRCLSPWLQHNCTCPMCNMCIRPETSGSCQLPDIL